MGRSLLTADSPLEGRVAELERIVADLASARRMGDASQRGGTFELVSEAGATLLEFGDYTDPNDTDGYGIQLKDAAGTPVLATLESVAGLVWPGDNSAFVPTTPQTITSGTFADYYAAHFHGITGDTLLLGGSILVPAGTTAEVRLRYNTTDYTNTATITSSNSRWYATWLHPFSNGWQPGVNIVEAVYLEVRRASGAGNVTLYNPSTCAIASSHIYTDATDTNPVVAV